MKTLGQQFSCYFNQVAKDCFNCFNASSQNTHCITVVSLAISLVGGTNEVKEFVTTNFNDLASCILQKYKTDQDPDLVKSFAGL